MKLPPFQQGGGSGVGPAAVTVEDLLRAAIDAPHERRVAALGLLRGELPTSEPYLTLAGLSPRTGFCTATLRRWQIPGHDMGGSTRYRLSEVQAYFATEEFRRRCAALRAERKAQREVAP